MNWLASFFAPGSKVSSRRGQAMSTTHEAFSLPSSPGFAPHPDAFNPDLLDPESGMSPSYTYPPQSPATAYYGYVPTSSGSRTQSSSLLPLHNTNAPNPTSSRYPPLSVTWNRLKIWLAREYPELGDTLNYGILPQDLAQIEIQFGFALPSAVRESYLCVDGQEAESSAGCSDGLLFGLTLLPLEDVLEEWRFWREVDEDPNTGANSHLRDLMSSIPDGWVRKNYSQRGWIPLVVDKAGNYIGVDLNPGEGGSEGQVIVFGRDFDTKVVLWRGDGPGGWAKWLSSFADELESGEGFELGTTSESEGSGEDDLGYEAYFYSGTGRGQGDGGGESGTTGLRLTGEYRGWNVLEAWADRSVRKWYESGIVPTPSPTLDKGKTPEQQQPGVTNSHAQGSDVEATTVLRTRADTVEDTGNATAMPTGSVTKPPVPLPVVLPTVNDIAPSPSPPNSTRSSMNDDDLEAGLREVPRQDVAGRPTSRTWNTIPDTNSANETNAGSLISLPTSPEVKPSDASHISSPPTVSMYAEFNDFLDESMHPASTPHVETSITEVIAPPVTEEAASAEPLMPTESDEDETQALTVRLVGGEGNTPSLVEDEDVTEETTLSAAQADVASITSSGVDKKRSSIIASGLKKFGQLGGGRRKKSSSSTKDVML